MTDVLAWTDDHPKAKVLARTRSAIIASARDLFLRLGFERTTMEGVAAAAGSIAWPLSGAAPAANVEKG